MVTARHWCVVEGVGAKPTMKGSAVLGTWRVLTLLAHQVLLFAYPPVVCCIALSVSPCYHIGRHVEDIRQDARSQACLWIGCFCSIRPKLQFRSVLPKTATVALFPIVIDTDQDSCWQVWIPSNNYYLASLLCWSCFWGFCSSTLHSHIHSTASAGPPPHCWGSKSKTKPWFQRWVYLQCMAGLVSALQTSDMRVWG